jgi:hypothetical protein
VLRGRNDKQEVAVRARELVFALVLALSPVSAFADIVILPDAEKWVEAAVKELAAGKTDEFANSYLKIIDQPQLLPQLAERLKPIQQLGQPAFLERVMDQRFGTSVRQLIYVALYNKTDYGYFKFVIKKNRGGWAVTSFDFRVEPGDAMPRGFLLTQ